MAERRDSVGKPFYELFPPSNSSIKTSDPQLTKLLQRIQSKVNEIVQNPWSTMQRTVLPEGGIKTVQQLGSVLLKYHVVLQMSELLFLWSSIPMLDGSRRFDWPQFVALLFPTEKGDHIAPRYRTTTGGGTGQTNGTNEVEKFMVSHPPSFPDEQFFGTGAGQTWGQDALEREQQRLEQLRTSLPADSTYPVGAPAPPAAVLARTTRAHQAERRRLEEAFRASRKPPPAIIDNTRALTHRPSFPGQRTQRHINAPISSRYPYSNPDANTRVNQPLPHPTGQLATSSRPSRPHPSSTTQQRTAPTYHLPVPHRVSTAVSGAPVKNGPKNYAHSINGHYEPYPDSIRRVNGEPVPEKPKDAYNTPSIQFGQPFRY